MVFLDASRMISPTMSSLSILSYSLQWILVKFKNFVLGESGGGDCFVVAHLPVSILQNSKATNLNVDSCGEQIPELSLRL